MFWAGFKENVRPHPTNMHLRALVTQPDNTRIWGTDHSPWDGNVDFRVTRARGASFTIIKATEGTVPMRYFHENTTRAREAGLVTGAYHWLHRNSNVSCAKQAEVAWNRIKGYANQLPLMVDFEWTRYNSMSANPSYADLELFVDSYTALAKHKPALYSAPGYLSPLGPIPKRLRDKLAYIVIASYYVDTPSYPDWLFHQFTDLGEAESIAPNDAGKKETDLIYFRNTYSALLALAGLGDPIPPPEPEPTGETMHGTVTTFTNIRADRNKNSADLGDLLTGDRLEYHDELWAGLDGLKYRRLINATRNGSPVPRNDGKAWGEVDAYAYAVNIKDDPAPTPAPVAAGRVRLNIVAEFVDADGVVTHSKTVLIDEPLEAV